MPNFEFVRLGVPCTVQTRDKSRLDNYRHGLRRIALGLWDGNIAPLALPVTVVITYYYADDALDVDNIIKPILDAMNKLVYLDDRQVIKVISQKFDVLARNTPLLETTPILTGGLRSKDNFIHILVEWK